MVAPRRVARVVAALGCAMLVGATTVACSSSKTLTFCTDPSYPPAEFYQVTKVGTADLKRQLAGADIDIAHAVADELGSSVRFSDTPFTGIFDALLEKRCDAVISMVNDTADRRTKVSFVDYLAAGQSIMSRKDAPTVAAATDLYGRTVAVARDTTEEQFLEAQNAAAPAGKSIKVLSFQTENDAIYALQQNAAEAYFGDTPVVTAAVSANKSLAMGAEIVKPTPIGIALRPQDDLIPKIKDAVKALYANGKMGQILAKWNFTRYALAS